jgi:hypothetical protein
MRLGPFLSGLLKFEILAGRQPLGFVEVEVQPGKTVPLRLPR